MTTRAVLHDQDDARAVAVRLARQGFSAETARERFAGEDDDEDHAWAVVTDAPGPMVELLVEELDGWLDVEEPAGGPPLELPQAPKRVKSHFPRD